MIRTCLRDLINDHKTPMKTDKVFNNKSQFGELKVQLVILNNCISSKNFEETRSIYYASKPVEIFVTSNTDDIIDTILQRLQEATDTSNEKGSKFIHESVGSLYYYFHKIDMKRSESYIKSPEWLINKRATTYPKTENDDNCLQYAKTAALNHQNIRKNPQRISKIKPFVNQCNWKEIKLPTE